MKILSILSRHFIIVGTFVLIAVTSSVIAESATKEVTLSQKGQTLNANLTMADGKKMNDGVILITHGTLAHNGMELIKAMQNLLAERGRSSLAINLSLGLDNRHGMYDCSVPHKHLHTDALDEISVWLNWLKAKGADKIVLMGHSRGGNQTAWFAAERPDPAIVKVVLLAPATWNEQAAKESYKKQFGVSAAATLAKAEKLVAEGKGSLMLDKAGFIYCKDALSTAAAFVSYNKPEPRMHTPTLMAKISVPVLVVAAANDNVVKGLIKAVEPLADGKKLTLKVVDEANHFFLDFAAEDAAEAIDEFLQE